jgi:hypothetical protein
VGLSARLLGALFEKNHLIVDTISEEISFVEEILYGHLDVSMVFLWHEIVITGLKEVILLASNSTSCCLELPLEG